MANIKSAAKRARQNEKRRIRNRRYLTKARNAVKTARLAISDPASDAPSTREALEQAYSNLDRAASKGVIHPKNAARRKSRLMAALHRTEASADNS